MLRSRRTAAYHPRPISQAYCLYRQGKLQEALGALKEVPANKDEARLQLEAQVRAGAGRRLAGSRPRVHT